MGFNLITMRFKSEVESEISDRVYQRFLIHMRRLLTIIMLLKSEVKSEISDRPMPYYLSR